VLVAISHFKRYLGRVHPRSCSNVNPRVKSWALYFGGEIYKVSPEVRIVSGVTGREAARVANSTSLRTTFIHAVKRNSVDRPHFMGKSALWPFKKIQGCGSRFTARSIYRIHVLERFAVYSCIQGRRSPENMTPYTVRADHDRIPDFHFFFLLYARHFGYADRVN
jgi:hypothetical protein